ncbi:MAG: exodeoxyribonuclease VII small subunit [Oscillospiraceae bacterium]|nr:exodeoxyribonuclease VII small subunit [Oscillospiraceae bacterium]
MNELEKIVSKLEKGDGTLEQNLKLYKQGVKLCSDCKNELDKAKLKIEYVGNEQPEE